MNLIPPRRVLGRHEVLIAVYTDVESLGFCADRNPRALFRVQAVPSGAQSAGWANKVGGVGLKSEIQSGAALGTDMEHDVQLGSGAGAVLEGGDESDLGVTGVAGHRQGKGSAQRRFLITTSRMIRKMPR